MTKKTTQTSGNANNRRRHEARGLRNLFASQWRYFQTMLEPGRKHSDTETQDPSSLTNAIETVVDGTDKRIRAIGAYKKRLRNTINMTLDYIDTAIAEIPAAIQIDKNSFANNPQINAFFVSVDDMQNIFSSSQVLQKFFKNTEYLSADEAYAILFLEHRDKTIFRKIMQNDMMINEVKQTAVNFSKHEIIAACDSEDAVRRSLKEYTFNQIVNYVSAHMQHIRQQQQEQINKGHTEVNLSGVCNPDVYLDELIKQLSIPGPLLSCEKISFRLNKMGIRMDGNSTETVNEFTVHEFQIGQQAPRLVTIVRYPRNAMLANTSCF